MRLTLVCAQLAALILGAAPLGATVATGTALSLLAQPAQVAHADASATGQITGAVFNDYNDDGYRNLISTINFPAVDVGVPGIAVTAYNGANVAVATTATDANGIYTLTTGLATSVPLRVEFTGYKTQGYESGMHGPNNNSSVRFVITSDTTISNVDFGIYKAREYCQNNPRVAITRFVFDNNLTGQYNTQPTCYSFPYASVSAVNDANKAARTQHSVGNQTGAVYGVAYHKPTRNLFLSAYAKRGTSFGPGIVGNPSSDGSGTIYKLNPATNAVAPFIDLDVVMSADVTGPDPHKLSDYDPRDGNASFDKFAYAQVGKMSLGDVDVDETDQTLWAVNMYDRALYKLPIGLNATAPAAGQITTYTIPSPNCANGLGRPMGMKPYQGKIYVGGVCTNEAITSTKGLTNMAGITQVNGLAVDLRAYVYALDVATGVWSGPVLQIPLNYSAGCTDIYTGYTTLCGKDHKKGSIADWRPWGDSFQQLINDGFPAGSAIDLNITGDLFTSYPQAMLADIEFTPNGDMVVGMRDRFSDQMGYLDPGPEQQHPFGVDTIAVASGDVLRASPKGDGTFVLESNAQSVPPGRFGPSAGKDDLQGPGGGEFYFGDANAPKTHDESSYGALAQMPGAPEVIASAADPLSAFSAGVLWLNHDDGDQNRAFQIYGFDEAGAFAKANGLGDVEILCEDAPIEIGNRVWVDVNFNGVQDPQEPPISGIKVVLSDGNGTVAETTTDGDGQYYFSNAITPTYPSNVETSPGRPGAINASALYSLPINYKTQYTVSVDMTQPALVLYQLTSPNKVDNTADGDIRDSDGVRQGNIAFVSFTTGTPNQNDHSFDFGFNNAVSLGNYVWFDVGPSGQNGAAGFNNGIAEVGEAGIGNVKLELYYDSNASGQFDAGDKRIMTTTTNSNGLYLFSNLSATQNVNTAYIVVVIGTNFCIGGALFGYNNSTGSVGGNSDLNNRDHGVQKTIDIGCGDVVASTPVTLTVGGEPVNDDDTDPNSNLTIDFGFYPFLNVNDREVGLGDLVWFDVNNDGVAIPQEIGVDGVAVELYQDTNSSGAYNAGDVLVDTTTTANGGLYFFGGLTPTVGITDTYLVVLPAANFCAGGPLQDYQNSTGSVGGNSDLNNGDHGIDPATGAIACGSVVASSPVTLTYGGEPITDGDALTTTNLTIDFGFYKLELGNYVWYDQNDNGKADAGEPSLPNVPVRLLNNSGTVLSNTVTNASGLYTFTNLAAGIYCAEITPPDGTTSSSGAGQSPNPDDNTDSDDNGVINIGHIIRSNCMTLTPGSEPIVITNTATTQNPTLDFGVWRPAGLGNFVWIDANQNGRQDKSEVPVPGVAVTLYDSAKKAISNTTTNASGTYIFTGLIPSSYYVCFGQPTGSYTYTIWMSDTTGMGSDQDSNANVNNGNCTLSVTLQPGEYNPTLDAGIYSPTAVLLSDFSVSPNGKGLRIKWNTTSEINTFGFALYRSESLGSAQDAQRAGATLITSQMISARGRGAYFVDDATADAGKRYHYWLQEVETTGTINEYGPATYSPQASIAPDAPVVPVVAANTNVVAGGTSLSAAAPSAPSAANNDNAANPVASLNTQNVSAVQQAFVSTANASNPAVVVAPVEANRAEVRTQPDAQPVAAKSAPVIAAAPQAQAELRPVVKPIETQSQNASAPATIPSQTTATTVVHQTQANARTGNTVTPPTTLAAPSWTTWLIVIVMSLIAFAIAGMVIGLAFLVGRRQ